jgi:hypothetical protein
MILKNNFSNRHHQETQFKYEAFLYRPSANPFHLEFPIYSNIDNFEYWDLGFIDLKSDSFYETGVITKTKLTRVTFLNDWLSFLENLIENKIYLNLFEMMHFNKGILFQNDRLLHEPAFIRAIKSLQTHNYDKEVVLLFEDLSVDFIIFLCDMIKDAHKMISFKNFKKKLSSNLEKFGINFN